MTPKEKYSNSNSCGFDKYENVLLSNGYHQSKINAGLFYKRILNTSGYFRINIRGTNNTPIFNWEFGFSIAQWKVRRLAERELVILRNSGCICHVSSINRLENRDLDEDKNQMASSQFVYDNFMINEEHKIFNWSNGYCKVCGKDFQDNGYFCSKGCGDKYINDRRLFRKKRKYSTTRKLRASYR